MADEENKEFGPHASNSSGAPVTTASAAGYGAANGNGNAVMTEAPRRNKKSWRYWCLHFWWLHLIIFIIIVLVVVLPV